MIGKKDTKNKHLLKERGSNKDRRRKSKKEVYRKRDILKSRSQTTTSTAKNVKNCPTVPRKFIFGAH